MSQRDCDVIYVATPVFPRSVQRLYYDQTRYIVTWVRSGWQTLCSGRLTFIYGFTLTFHTRDRNTYFTKKPGQSETSSRLRHVYLRSWMTWMMTFPETIDFRFNSTVRRNSHATVILCIFLHFEL